MQIETVDQDNARVFRVRDTVTVASDLGSLRELVEQSLRQGVRTVSLCFDQKSHLYTHHLSILAQCLAKVRASGGSLALVNPNDSIVEALKAVGLTGLTMRYTPEDGMFGAHAQE